MPSSMFLQLSPVAATPRRIESYNAACVRAVRELADCLASLAVVHENLVVRTHTREMVPRGREPDILNELRVRLDGLS